MADDKPIIVIKKKGGHGGHHGGAWKIAYADFVTAMMAFFMVMWLVNSASVVTKKNIANYFRRPGIFDYGSGTPLQIGGSGILEEALAPPETDDYSQGSGGNKKPEGKETAEEISKRQVKPLITPFSIMTAVPTPRTRAVMPAIRISPAPTVDPEETPPTSPRGLESAGKLTSGPGQTRGDQDALKTAAEVANLVEQQRLAFARIEEQIRREIAGSPELQKLLGSVDVRIDADGLNIEIMDTERSSMFASGSARIQPEAKTAFAKLAAILSKLPNTIDIVGHTDAKPFSTSADGYSNWDLSADRANAARRLMQQFSIDPKRITSIVGRADQDLKLPDKPFAAANRRITLKLKFDLTKSIDLAREPSALDDLDSLRPTPAPAPAPRLDASQTGAAEEGSEVTGEKAEDREDGGKAPSSGDKVHSFTAKEILEESRERKRPQVPANEPTGMNPEPSKGRDGGMFSENPVLGPQDPFFGF